MRLFLNAMVGKVCLHFTVQKKKWMRKAITHYPQPDLELLKNKPPLFGAAVFLYAEKADKRCLSLHTVDESAMQKHRAFFIPFLSGSGRKKEHPRQRRPAATKRREERNHMKREDIKNLLPDISKENLDAIMDLHSADVGAHKQNVTALTTERDQLKTQLEEANKQIQSYKDMDIEAVKKSAADWEAKHAADTKALQDKLDAANYGFGVERAVAGLKFSSTAARNQFVADLTAKKLPLQEGKLLGLDDYVKGYKEQDPGAFLPENDDKTPVAVKGGSGGASLGTDAALRAAFGLPDEKK